MNFCWESRMIDTFAFSRISMYVVLQSSEGVEITEWLSERRTG